MAKRFQLCILHIGTEKTGTTTIQSFLSANRKKLAADGFLYTVSAGKDGSQWGYVACAVDKPWASDIGMHLHINDGNDRESYKNRMLSSLEREFQENTGCHALLISSEHFHSRLKTVEEIARLRDLVEPYADNFLIVLYLRRQDQMAVSYYSTKLKSGVVAPILFPENSNQNELVYYFDYESIYNNWKDIFAAASMRVRLFEEKQFCRGDLLEDFCESCGIDIAGKQIPERANESLSKEGMDFLLELNKQLPRVVERKQNPVHVGLSSFVAALCRGRGQPALRSEAMGFYERYRPGNERLKTLLFPDLESALFEEDFSDYPDYVDHIAPRYEDAVSIAINIWRHRKNPRDEDEKFNELEKVSRELQHAKAENAFLRGQLAMKNGNVENAKKFYGMCLQLNTRHARAHFAMARMLLKSGERNQGIQHLEDARKYFPEINQEVENLYAQYITKKE